MLTQHNQPSKRRAAVAIASAALQARRLANRWIHERLPTDCTCGEPRPLQADTWTAPILLAHPGLVVGQVGWLTIDLTTEQVIEHTPVTEIVAAGDHLVARYAEAIQTAYLHARGG